MYWYVPFLGDCISGTKGPTPDSLVSAFSRLSLYRGVWSPLSSVVVSPLTVSSRSPSEENLLLLLLFASSSPDVTVFDTGLLTDDAEDDASLLLLLSDNE